MQRSHLIPVTNYQDFFGGSLIDAMASGVYPLVPNRLAYPEHITPTHHTQHLYADDTALLQKTIALLENPQQMTPSLYREWAMRYDWTVQAPKYDAALEEVVRL
ncbi:MAG: hypothetical protein R2795_11555 [Saprospiraceae bacterium]